VHDDEARWMRVVIPASRPLAVIPAKAGILFDFRARPNWIPAFAGMTVKGVGGFRSSRLDDIWRLTTS
jgi:hypothetical protein